MTQVDDIHGSMTAVEHTPFESGERTVSVDEAVRLHEIARRGGDIAVSVVVWPGQIHTAGVAEVELRKDQMRLDITIINKEFSIVDLYDQLHDKPQNGSADALGPVE